MLKKNLGPDFNELFRNFYDFRITSVDDVGENRSIREMLNLFAGTTKNKKYKARFSIGLKSTFLVIANFSVTMLITKSSQLKNSCAFSAYFHR